VLNLVAHEIMGIKYQERPAHKPETEPPRLPTSNGGGWVGGAGGRSGWIGGKK